MATAQRRRRKGKWESLIIFGTCLGHDQTKYERIARPRIERVASADDLILTTSGENGICRAYNGFLDTARATPECDGVVLIHDDVEILDRNFRADVLRVLSDGSIGVAGVAGGAGLRGLAWWHARRRFGALYESRGHTKLGPRIADVDVVDGCVMVITQNAMKVGRFDEENFPAFHGYDADFCLQAREAGLRVTVLPLDVAHHTKGGYGDKQAFKRSDRALRRKWPQFIRAGLLPVVVVSALVAGRRWLRDPARVRAREILTRFRPAMPDSAPVTDADAGEVVCPICSQMYEVRNPSQASIVECETCRVGITWPPPGRDVEGEGIFQERYGGLRLLLRRTWDREARLRTDWLKIYVPEGCVLEIGAATGEFVLAAGRAGYDAYGVEVSDWAARHARRRGADVTTGYLDDWIVQRPGARPDAIAMWHVLEHVPDPCKLLRQIAALIGPGGVIALEVPNFDSIDAQRLGIAWDAAQPLDHFHHFRQDSLRSLLEQAGFCVEHTVPIARNVYLPARRWMEHRNSSVLDGRPTPAIDLLRAIARVGSE